MYTDLLICSAESGDDVASGECTSDTDMLCIKLLIDAVKQVLNQHSPLVHHFMR